MHVDRATCAWLIRRFVDDEAEFGPVGGQHEVPDGTIAFDMRGAEHGHRGGDCTFETTLVHGLLDRVLARIAEIVHEADPEDERLDAPKRPGST